MTDTHGLSPALVERVLEGLGLEAPPDISREGVEDLYAAWCRRVPFDNVRKLIHLRNGGAGSLPGDDPASFFESWLEHGTGATCWAESGAMWALLAALGFRAQRVLATITFAPDLPPNHGSTIVDIGGDRLVVDSSMLHGEPLPLCRDRETAVEHPAWGMPARFEDGKFWFVVRPLLAPLALQCRLDVIGASTEQIRERHESTRAWGPFNYALSVRINRSDSVLGIAWGERIEIDAEGEREAFLVDEVGLSEEIVDRIPDDLPTPPPAGVGGDSLSDLAQ